MYQSQPSRAAASTDQLRHLWSDCFPAAASPSQWAAAGLLWTLSVYAADPESVPCQLPPPAQVSTAAVMQEQLQPGRVILVEAGLQTAHAWSLRQPSWDF